MLTQYEKKAFEDATIAYENELDLYKRAFNFIESRAEFFSTLDKRKSFALNTKDPEKKKYNEGMIKAGAAIHELIYLLHDEIRTMRKMPF